MTSLSFGPLVEAFDEKVDALLEQARGNEHLDRVMTIATHAGEFSAIWHVCSAARGLAKGRSDQSVALAIGIAAESLVVNQGLKRLFRRERPTPSGDERFKIRTPLTSSFPSGHASAAGFAATTLIGWDGARSAPLWGALAGTVAASRPYVRIHHPSDVVAGAAFGIALGLVARRVFRGVGLG
jgi:hypothetical protein